MPETSDPAHPAPPMPATGMNPEAGASLADTAKQLAHDGLEKAKALKDDAATAARQFQEAASAKASDLGQTIERKAEALRSSAGEVADGLLTSAEEQWRETVQKGKELQITTEDYVRQHPTRCVVGALALGFLIGAMSRR